MSANFSAFFKNNFLNATLNSFSRFHQLNTNVIIMNFKSNAFDFDGKINA